MKFELHKLVYCRKWSHKFCSKWLYTSTIFGSNFYEREREREREEEEEEEEEEENERI